MPGTPRRLTKEDVLQVLDDRDRQECPVMTTAEIVERVDASRPVVNDRLNELREEDEPRIRWANKGQARVYWLANDTMYSREESTSSEKSSAESVDNPEPQNTEQPFTDGGEIVSESEHIDKIQQKAANGAGLTIVLGILLSASFILYVLSIIPVIAPVILLALVMLSSILSGYYLLRAKFEQNKHTRSLREAIRSGDNPESASDVT